MITFEILTYGSCAYHEMVQLRDEVLRKPLGLSFTEAYLQQEINDILLAALIGGKVVGCCILTPVNDTTVQLRQMAVSPGFQGQQVGAQVLAFAERQARDGGFKILMMHARKVAVPFYGKNGYEIIGDEFTEVGIPHFTMQKRL